MTVRYSIGIPTFNRPALLAEALGYATAQEVTDFDLEIIVSDNGNCSKTRKVVDESQGHHIRYWANPENIGPAANFAKTVELATGEYFSWLQDDDGISCDFARRAVSALASNPEAVAYISFPVWARSFSSMCNGTIFTGVPFQLDWSGQHTRCVEGSVATPWSLFLSLGIPPTLAVRREVLLECLAYFFVDSPLLAERTLLAAIGARGPVILDPRIGGLYRRHETQFSVTRLTEPLTFQRDWQAMAKVLDGISAELPDGWEDIFEGTWHECDTIDRAVWVRQTATWPTDLALCRKVKGVICRGDDSAPSTDTAACVDRRRRPFLHWASKELCPPLLLRAMRAILQRGRALSKKSSSVDKSRVQETSTIDL